MFDFGIPEPVEVVEEEAADEVIEDQEGDMEDFAKTLAATAVTALAAALMI